MPSRILKKWLGFLALAVLVAALLGACTGVESSTPTGVDETGIEASETAAPEPTIMPEATSVATLDPTPTPTSAPAVSGQAAPTPVTRAGAQTPTPEVYATRYPKPSSVRPTRDDADSKSHHYAEAHRPSCACAYFARNRPGGAGGTVQRHRRR